MVTYQYGGKNGRPRQLQDSDRLVVTRSRVPGPIVSALDEPSSVPDVRPVASFGIAGVAVVESDRLNSADLRDRLREMPHIRSAGRALTDEAGRPVVYTENLFVKFRDDATDEYCRQILGSRQLTVKRPLKYAKNAYFVEAREGIGRDLFPLAMDILDQDSVEFCHPELIREVRRRQMFAEQWHLDRTKINGVDIDAHANVAAAWALSTGKGRIIAVIDDGCDLDHEELKHKIVHPRDVTRGTDKPVPGPGDNHGTACCGVAAAAGRVGASGVAPDASVMPIRFASMLGSQQEADAFEWAADHGADVISCSWGPTDGQWWNPNDPAHDVVVDLPDSTRLAIDYAITTGRNGLGCIITWAAGNGNEPVENDGYASYERVIAVAACNDKSGKSAYSDFGGPVWCTFPSNNGDPSLTTGIWTTDVSGSRGYNPGSASEGDIQGNYTNSFGGTSSACPGTAGVAALILQANPNLRWDEVKDILKRTSTKIGDPAEYDASGHSASFGYGRVDALAAVRAALGNSAAVEMAIEEKVEVI